MASKDRLISNLHKILREDSYITEICTSSGIEMDNVIDLATDIYNNYFFDTMTWGADIVANWMNITFDPNLTQDEKNSLIEARWKNNGKSDIDLLQNIANSWKNGDTTVSFTNGTIQIKFVGDYGTPSDLSGFQSEIEKAKPAHLIVEYLFKYLLISDIDQVMTISQIQTMTLNEFAF